MRLATLATALATPLALTACTADDLALLSAISNAGPKAQEYVAKLEEATLGNAMMTVARYCAVHPLTRDTLRKRLNNRPEGGGAQIAIWCPGDPVVMLPDV